MSAMKDLVQKAITPEKAVAIVTKGNTEGVGKSGTNSSLMAKIVPRRLILDQEGLETPHQNRRAGRQRGVEALEE